MSVTRLALLHATRNILLRRHLAAALGLCLAATWPAAADQRIHGEYERTFTVTDPVTVVVKNLVGNFDLRAGVAGQVRIHATISHGTDGDCDRARAATQVKRFEENPAVRMEGSTVYVGVWDDMSNHHCSAEAYAIDVPASSRIQVEAQIGSVSIFDIAGPIRVKIGVGEIRLQDPGASVDAAIATGSIYLAGKPGGDWNLDAGTGGAELHIPRGAGFRLDAEANHNFSSFQSEFGQRIRLSNTSQRDSSRVQESYNGGGPLVRVRVDKGSIRIRER